MESVLDLLDVAGAGLLRWVVWMNLWCGLLLAVAVAADLLLARRVGPAWRVLLYAAVLVRVLVPPGATSPIGLAAPAPIEAHVRLGPAPHDDATVPLAAAAEGPSERAGVSLHARHVVLPVYALVAAVLCAAWARGELRIRRGVREARPTGRALGPSGRWPVLAHRSSGPALVGVLSPKLLMPEWLLDDTRARWVERHEAGHAVRRDPLLAACAHAVVVAAWPVLAVWVAAARMRALMEEACDDLALRGAAAADRVEYGRALLDLAAGRAVAPLRAGLPFGAGVRSRIRALSRTRRWPAFAQAALAVIGAAVPLACTGSPAAPASARQTRIENAQEDPFKGSLPLRVTVLRSWPEHPSLDFARDGNPARVLERDVFATVLSRATEADPGAVLTRPRLEVVPGMRATVSVGDDRDTFTLASTVNRVMIPAGGVRSIYTLDVDASRAGDAGAAAAVSVRGVDVPQGRTLALLATGRGGARLLVCVAPGPDDVQVELGDAAGAADARPLIHFTARIHRVDAPRDYGSPKGDGPRRSWSAYPGGQALFAKDFEAYLEELRRRPGYALLAAHDAWAAPGQEATIDLRPEPDNPDALHVVRLRGEIDGVRVLSTGAYSRSAGGLTSEGSWNRPTVIGLGGAMVWSIHDPGRGAWYTLTVQAEGHGAGTIRPQRATGPPP